MSKNTTTTDGFFDVQEEKSKIKALIVTEFFKAYFPIISHGVGKSQEKILYLDLFSGPGKYNDGSPSTPLIMLDLIENFKDNSIREKMQLIFNDKDTNYYNSLKDNVLFHSVYDKLKYKPIIQNLSASEVPIDNYLAGNKPAFSFVDPFGYVDVSTDLVWKLIKNLGSDCVLFFNSNRILQDLSKPMQEKHFAELFGEELDNVKKIQSNPNLKQKEKCDKFVKSFSKNLYNTINKEKGKYKLFVLPFCIESDTKSTISHYILFITKSHKAIVEMKKVMLKKSNSTNENLQFDSKEDEMQISFISRENNVTKNIIFHLKEMIKLKKTLCSEDLTISTLMEKLDRYSMYTRYIVFPYAQNEVKETIELLYEKGYIDAEIRINAKKAITDKASFKIKESLLEENNVTKI